MPAQLKRQTAHEELLRAALRGRLSEPDALLWMVLFHTHGIRLKPGVMPNGHRGVAGAELVLAPVTQHHAAEIIAAVWPDRSDPRADNGFWYWEFNTRTPYEVLSDVPEELRSRLLTFRDLLAQDPRVDAVLEVD